MFDCSLPPPYTIPLSPATSPTCLTRALYAKIATTSAPAVVAIIGYDGGKSSSSSSSSSRKSDPIESPRSPARPVAAVVGRRPPDGVSKILCVFNVQSYDTYFPRKKQEIHDIQLKPSTIPPIVEPQNSRRFRLSECCCSNDFFSLGFKPLHELKRKSYVVHWRYYS
jgi:hypothetical protein